MIILQVHFYYLLYNVPVAEVDEDTSTLKRRFIGNVRKVKTILSGMKRNRLLYFSDVSLRRLGIMLMWIKDQNKKDAVLHVTCTGPVELFAKWRCAEAGLKEDWPSTSKGDLLTFINWVTNCVKIKKSPWQKVARSDLFPFLSLPIESSRLENSSKIIQSNHPPITNISH